MFNTLRQNILLQEQKEFEANALETILSEESEVDVEELISEDYLDNEEDIDDLLEELEDDEELEGIVDEIDDEDDSAIEDSLSESLLSIF